MMEPKPSPTGGELQSRRGGGMGRLALLDAAPQAKPGPGGGGAAGGGSGAQARTPLPPSHDPHLIRGSLKSHPAPGLLSQPVDERNS